MCRIITQFNNDISINRPFFGYQLAHKLTFNGCCIYEWFFHNFTHFCRNLRNDGTNGSYPVLRNLVFIPSGYKQLEIPPEVLERKNNLLFDLCNAGNSVLTLAGEWHICGCNMDKDQNRSRGEPLLGNVVGFPVDI